MKMKMWLLVGLAITGGSVLARETEEWNQGQLFLQNGTHYEGALSFSWKTGTVEFKEGNVIKAYSAMQVRAFNFVDTKQNSSRKFVTLNFPIKRGLRRPVILEEVALGRLPVYRRLNYTRGFLPFFNDGLDDETQLDNFTYYMLDGKKFLDLKKFRRLIWPMMKADFADEAEKKSMELQTSFQLSQQDVLVQLRLINWYNYRKLRDSREAMRSQYITISGY